MLFAEKKRQHLDTVEVFIFREIKNNTTNFCGTLYSVQTTDKFNIVNLFETHFNTSKKNRK